MTSLGFRGAGSVFKTTNNGKSCFCASKTVTSVNGKRRFIRGFGDTEKAAYASLERLLRRHLENPSVPKSVSPKLKDFLPVWLKHVKASDVQDSTLLKYQRDQEHHILPLLGDLRLESITSQDLENVFYTDLPRILGPRAIQHCYTELNSLLIYANSIDVIESNPMRLVKRPTYSTKIKQKQNRFMGRYKDMSKHLLTWLEQEDCPYHDDYPRVLFMMLGLRRAELLGLTWDCVKNLNRKNKAVLIIHQELMRHEVNSGLTGWYIADRTKNSKPREITLPERWRKALIEEKNKGRKGGNGWDANLIFLTQRNKCINYNRHSERWKMILTDYYNLSKPKKEALPDDYYWRPHDNRHICASILIEEGVPVSTVQDLLGHTDDAMTLYYTHTTGESRHKAGSILDKQLT
ncbi:tyrosine-type recombinase/integrase [Bifidobacterium crudilactis]|jgi:integrase|uniref:Tyrosine-type recombinase/integrase n=2 Tax=Bifidobacterium crudilactis TaxID=327277 RepID=A0A971CYQ7_9BIFI|nr:tyrosine-type recombinase/integrase [Bifidobacterium crudilactis]MCI1868325.1 tyrosine-type recombinase/integrase [Bifidobacterium crudilactis]MDN6000020.1 tyrosine-type recombinase/integrase [Bifidobacterium crudilactis]MDN6210234.1 tyrosine-type recombinase/integrase [Bifidobacterium crudilactis]MDN6557951.1 tyrosine-type recombinase/integrase [Bifidobacterium crudilactis]MDN6815799.1 tyrosine-type recombinase/integrase [Bifidobacterium crudilactis]